MVRVDGIPCSLKTSDGMDTVTDAARRKTGNGRGIPSSRNRRPAQPISRERVIAGAVALVERHGLAGLSMRRLATGLGIRATTLYYYFPNKAAILDSLVETILFDSPRPELGADAPWFEHLRAHAVAFYESLRQHPRLVPLAATHSIQSPRSLAAAEAFVAQLCRQGLPPLRAVQALNIVTTFVLGHALAEVGGNGNDRDESGGPPQPPDVGALPLLGAALQAGLGQPAEQRARFAIGLEALLRGLALVIPNRA